MDVVNLLNDQFTNEIVDSQVANTCEPTGFAGNTCEPTISLVN